MIISNEMHIVMDYVIIFISFTIFLGVTYMRAKEYKKIRMIDIIAHTCVGVCLYILLTTAWEDLSVFGHWFVYGWYILWCFVLQQTFMSYMVRLWMKRRITEMSQGLPSSVTISEIVIKRGK